MDSDPLSPEAIERLRKGHRAALVAIVVVFVIGLGACLVLFARAGLDAGLGAPFGLGILLVGVLPVVGAVWLFSLLTRRANARWLAAAATLGLSPIEPTERDTFLCRANRAGASLHAPVRGKRGRWSIEVRAYYTSAVMSDNQETAVEVVLAGADPAFTLRVSRAGVADRLVVAAGGEDVEVGDSAFDRAFRVRSSDAERARLALSPAVREALLALPAGARVELEPATLAEDGSALGPEEAKAYADLGARLGIVEPVRGPVAFLRLVRYGVHRERLLEADVDAVARLADAIASASPAEAASVPPRARR